MSTQLSREQLALVRSALLAQRSFWVAQEAFAQSVTDAELGALAARYVRAHDELLRSFSGEQNADRLAIEPSSGGEVARRGESREGR